MLSTVFDFLLDNLKQTTTTTTTNRKKNEIKIK